MQTLHTHRTKVRPCTRSGHAGWRRRAGFTLIELMVTIAVVSILAAVAFAGFRQNDYRTQYSRFVADVEGILITARDIAIDNSTRTQVSVSATSVVLQEFDEATNTWNTVDRADIAANLNTDLLLANSNACVYGLTAGVTTPAQSAAITAPAACASATQVLQFEPDGTFTDPGATFSDVDNAGVTLWIADTQVSAETKLSIIEVFPGGLIRTFERTNSP